MDRTYLNRKLATDADLEQLLDAAAVDYRHAEEAGDEEAMKQITRTYNAIRDRMLREKIARGEVK